MSTRRFYFALLFFVLIVAVVAASGATFLPGAWYAQLNKPSWTPPNWFFPLIWSVLYAFIAIAGWLIFSGANRLLKILWLVQLLLNGLWSWLFFGLHRTGLGLLDIVALLSCIAALIWVARQQRDMNLVRLMMPYWLWVACAAALNAHIYIFNPG
jgi:tryptophan-rich sensory protein